ncbi:ATP12 family protein [Asticcacaulis sp. EMRT-3]|uniref:ATP12 family protein n=1 Tax=Asticcacaulis sp. EMRT-3 TaxID=3040349 RepID=UPI0024AEF839|nr:ATP12 family protein [Asticcacaulis sp. EMRT-3]MDI7774050.1 ATP12 family protein [Asticcacaulis sp. EMRT-3]
MTYKAEAPSKASDQLGFRPKRFWQVACAVADGGIYEVHLDGRPVKTPTGKVLRLPGAALAEAVAAEWAAVDKHVEFADMPLTRLGFAASDRMDERHEDTVAEVLRYAETDLLCYPSDYPEALKAREAAAWLPLLDWARTELDLDFHQNKTLIHQPQPAETTQKISELLTAMNAFERAGLMAAIPLFGSVVLALAVWRGHLTGEQAFAASRIGEDFQTEQWGHDAEADQRAAGHRAQAASCDVWFRGLS